MKKVNIYIDFGGNSLKVFKKGEGLILKEPTLVSVKKQNNKLHITAFGKDVLSKKHPESEVVSLISHGEIINLYLASEFLKNKLGKLFSSATMPNIYAKVIVTSALPLHEQKKYFDVFKMSGFKNIDLLDSSEVIRLSLNPELKKKNICIVDLGASKVSVDTFKANHKVCSAMLGIGGKTIENAIKTLFFEEKFVLSDTVCEQINKELSSLFEKDIKHLEVSGINPSTNQLESKTITSKKIYPIYYNFFKEISLVIKASVREFLAKHTNDDIDLIYVIGGLSSTSGLEVFLSKELNIPQIVIDNNFDNALILRISQYFD